MKSLMAWSLAAALVPAAFMGAGQANAAEPESAKPDAVKPAEDGRLSDEALLSMLKGLGYNPTVSKSADGKITFYRLDKTVANFRYIIDVSLQEGGKTVAFSCPLKRVGEPEKVPAEKLWAMLSKNDEIYPMFFSFEKSRKQFFLNHQIDNRDLTAERLGEVLDAVKHQVNATASVWDTTNWPGGPQPAAKAPTAADNVQPK
jgi:hypothetical protein